MQGRNLSNDPPLFELTPAVIMSLLAKADLLTRQLRSWIPSQGHCTLQYLAIYSISPLSRLRVRVGPEDSDALVFNCPSRSSELTEHATNREPDFNDLLSSSSSVAPCVPICGCVSLFVRQIGWPG